MTGETTIKYNQALHIFSFPFTWRCAKKDASIDKRFKFKTMCKALKDCNWSEDEDIKYDEGKLFSKDTEYNTYSYYYPCVRKSIFNSSNKNKSDKTVVSFIKNDLSGDAKYIIKCTNDNNEKEFKLDLIKITLKVYITGVGILSYFTRSTNVSDEDINIINEFGRRVYPQFISEGTNFPKNKFLADEITLILNKEKKIIEPFNLLDKNTSESIYKNKGTIIGNHVLKILGKNFVSGSIIENYKKNKNIVISPIIDDRMFVACYLFDESIYPKINNDNTKDTADKQEQKIDVSKIYENEKIYKYVFLEPSLSCQNDEMLNEILRNNLYTRWVKKGTMYGFSEYSFVAIIDRDKSEKLNYFTDVMFPTHFSTLYHEMICLCLMQYASIISFEEEITRISCGGYKDIDVREVSERFSKFNAALYFRQVTAQEQGREMYDIIQRIMNIKTNLNELKKDIDDLQKIASLKVGKFTSTALAALTVLGGLFIKPRFVISYLGINEINLNINLWIYIPIYLSIIIFIMYMIFSKKKAKFGNIIMFIAGLLVIYAALLPLIKQ